MNRALIADVQRTSLHDGCGIRTTVFFKGCVLYCEWCHNPECISNKKELLYYPEKCIGCGMCEKGCYSGAKVVCGKEYTSEELLKEILLDKPYFENGGGVTFSGGEPLLQKEFLKEIIEKCRAENIGCAVETSLALYDEKIFEMFDFIMADFKIWDSDIHKKYTGMSNEKIKENFIRLNTLGIPIIARTPVITEIRQEINKISEFLKTLENVVRYELLPYHPLGIAKAAALGKGMKQFPIPSVEYMEEMNKYAFLR